MKFLFEEADLRVLKARHHIDNPYSGSVMTKCHMKLIDISKNSPYMAVHSITRKEYSDIYEEGK